MDRQTGANMAPTILIVDDDQDCLRLLSLLLERENYRVRSALDGQAALAIAHAERIDLVSLDVILPDLSGLDLCQRLRKTANFVTKPIILLSARASTEDRKAAIAAGADVYLNKATQITRWVATVGELLANPTTQPIPRWAEQPAP